MASRTEPTIPAILWLCAAAVVHYSSYQGADAVAELGHGKLELRQFAQAVRDTVHPQEQAMEVTFVDPMAPDVASPTPTTTAPEPPKPAAKKPDEKKPDEKKPDEKKPDEKKPDEKKKEEIKKPAEPEPPKPMPQSDKRIAVKQHVEDKNQKDNPTAKHIGDDANHVKDESAAKITSHDQDDPKPNPGANAAGPTKEVGNAEKTHVADSDDHPGDAKAPPGEKSPQNSPVPKPAAQPSPAKAADAKPAAAAPKGGDAGQGGPKEPAPTPTAAPVPAPTPAPKPAPVPDTMKSDKGEHVINPFRSGDDAASPGASASAATPPTAAPIYSLPKLGGAPGPKGVNFNLTPGMAIAAIGVETIKRERALDGERRKSAHRGSWKASPIDKWRAAIENYVPRVKTGNTTALNTARVPFASYLNLIHNRLHPLFADDFLSSLDELPKEHQLNRKLSASLEVVVDGEQGRIVRMGVTKTSGVTAFDIAALDAMERASGGSSRGFGKPPPVIVSPDGNVYLHWEFHRNPDVACTTANARPYKLQGSPSAPEQGPEKAPPRAPEPPRERGAAPPGKAGQRDDPKRPKTG